MARLHLFELEDQSWFPAVLRDAGTAYLRTVASLTRQPGFMAPKLAELLRASGATRLVDLCSGGGGPIPGILGELEEQGIEASATLTDFFPNTPALELAAEDSKGRIDFRPEPVDATKVPAELKGCRTLFNGLHHFRPDAARAILRSAAESKQPVAVFEVAERTAQFFLGILFSPIIVLLVVPFLRPFRFSWLVFTYLIPIIPLFVLWDGLVSGLRVYSPPELDALVDGLGDDDYVWESGRIKMGVQPIRSTYLIGYSKS